MAYDLKLADYAALNDEEAEEVLAELENAVMAPRNGQLAIMNARIRDFETRYEMSSAQMLERLRAGAMKETAEIVKWLNLLDAREDRLRCG